MTNLLAGPPPVHLPDDPEPRVLLDGGADPIEVAGRYPASSLAWARCAEAALADGRVVEGYAFARAGYHRGLDQLRRHGWSGQGPVPWSHEPNRGFLRALHALARAAGEIGESEENQRCAEFLRETSPEAAKALGE